MSAASPWDQLYGNRELIKQSLFRAIQSGLEARPPGPRNQVPDDAIFAPLANFTQICFNCGDWQLPIELFEGCFSLALEYEAKNACEVHKGAMTFNVGIAYFQASDFPAAMHHFELAQIETAQTTGVASWEVFTDDLFKKNFWDNLDRFQGRHPLLHFKTFWDVDFGSVEAIKDFKKLSVNSKLNYIMVNAERMGFYLPRLKAIPHWNGAESVGLSYWNLIADLCRLLETELTERGITNEGLNSKVLSGLSRSPLPGFGSYVNSLHGVHPIKNWRDFNLHFPCLKSLICDATLPKERRIMTAAYLAGATRNQVQHGVEKQMLIFKDRGDAAFTADVFLALCRWDGWVP